MDSEQQIWFYLDPAEDDVQKQTKGPVSIRDIDVMLRTNLINSNVLVFRDGFPDWTAIYKVDELKECLDDQAEEQMHMLIGKERKQSFHSPKPQVQQNNMEMDLMELQKYSEEEDDLEGLQLDDEAKIEIIKKKIEKNRKKSQKEKEKKKQKWYTPKINTNIYIEGLPPDATVEEMKQIFQKAGIIRINPENLQPIIKLYTDNWGKCKGDGLVSYKMGESVAVAKDLLDGIDFRPGLKIKVTEAVFEQKGDYRAREDKKIDKMKKTLARQKEMTQMAWEGQDDGEGFKIVIIRNLFSPPQNEEFFQELYGEILNECETLGGRVHKLELFQDHPKGIVKVKFESGYNAEQCINAMNGQKFRDRLIMVSYWNGKENFKHTREEKEDEENRLEEFGKWLEEQEDENHNNINNNKSNTNDNDNDN